MAGPEISRGTPQRVKAGGTHLSAKSTNDVLARAIILGRELGDELISRFPEEILAAVRDLEHLQNYADIGAQWVQSREGLNRPDIDSREVLRHAVSHAISHLMGQSELTVLAAARKRANLKMITGEPGTEESRAFFRNAALKRLESGIQTDITPSILARGQVPWSIPEQEKFLELLNTHQAKGRFSLIADLLNRTFHEDRQVRTAMTVLNWYTDIRRKARANPQKEFWQKFLEV
ncbi:hypothetical protein EPN27_04190 [Patescibacteria group bacterium]|nr:MAG: hypothetical protein EPN27_04190 [Patescibacteria group bacterium]